MVLTNDSTSSEPGVTVIFPMAGRGERFGTTFKPFLRIDERAFIEAAVEPFRKWPRAVSRLLFVFLKQQEADFSVTARLREMFAGLPWEAVLLDHPTAGPAETVAGGVERGKASGQAIICDCDHAVNVDPMFERLERGDRADCLLPVWDLAGEDVKSWSVAALEADGRVTAIAEKEIPPHAPRVAGVIGCYYFRDVAEMAEACRREGHRNVSEAIAEMIRQGRTVQSVPIRQARFFGDPARLAKAVAAPGQST